MPRFTIKIEIWNIKRVLKYVEFLENQLQEKDKVIEAVGKWHGNCKNDWPSECLNLAMIWLEYRDRK